MNTVNVLKFCTQKCLTKWHMQNGADPDQTVCRSIKYFKKELHKKQNLGQNSME